MITEYNMDAGNNIVSLVEAEPATRYVVFFCVLEFGKGRI
jgi:hypothetical protein